MISKQNKILSLIVTFLLIVCYKSLIAQTFKKTKTGVTHENKIVSYEILENGDTINKLTVNNQKIGKWLINHEEKYGEIGYMEYGVFENNKKVGTWKYYSIYGQLLAIENYKNGNKNGEQRYFDNGKLYCIGNYLALKNKYEYDTIDVEDPITNITKPVVIKSDVGSVRHGFWTYYNIINATIEKVVEYQADEIIYEKEYLTKSDSAFILQKIKSFPHISNKEPANVWHFNKNKKAVRYTDE